MKATRRSESAGSALVVTLLLVVLITILVAALASVVFSENRSARLSFDAQQASLITSYALDTALDRIGTALEPFDDPFGAAASPEVFWSLAPGRIDHYPLASGQARPVSSQTFDLHSGAPFGLAAADVVDLNRADGNGIRPIDNSLSADKTMSVAWMPVLQNPSGTASPTNKLIGRFAFWVDDEGAKINLNTADGTEKASQALSYGPGTPTEVSLGAVSGDLTAAMSAGIAQRARNGGFALPGEIEQVPGVPDQIVRDNNFLLTTYSRSPEFNIFNEPRLQLAPTNLRSRAGLAWGDATSIFASLLGSPTRPGNLLHRAPVRSVYPSPNQITGPLGQVWPILPALIDSSSGWHNTQTAALIKTAKIGSSDASGWSDYSPEYAACAEKLARYLTGVNGRGGTVEWPFSNDSFEGKYNLRQLDSITVQMLDLAKMGAPKGTSLIVNGTNQVYDGRAYPTLAIFGLLQDKPVSGIGRSPRLTEFYGEITMDIVNDSSGNPKTGYLQGNLMVELYYPMGSFHRNYDLDPGYDSPNGSQLHFGHLETPTGGTGVAPSVVNSLDAPREMTPSLAPILGPGAASEVDGASYWMDNLLVARDQNGGPAGVDFWGNKSNEPDPDQAKAALFREPVPQPIPPDPNHIAYPGFGGNATGARPLLRFSSLGDAVIPAGTYTVTRNLNFPHASRPGYKLRDPLGGDAVTSVAFSGRLVLWMPFFTIYGRGMADFAPIESLTGPARASVSTASRPNFAGASAAYDSNAGLEIPSVTVSPGSPGRFHLYVRDPFVNKNEGDWIARTDNVYLTMPVTFPGTLSDSTLSHATHNHDANDMAACWIGTFSKAGVGDWTTPWKNLSTQAGFPSVGMLHYLRTKMIPDTGGNQGVPFRCLSFAAPGDGSQSGIPDWAMLDLVTVPAGMWRQPASAFALASAPDFAFSKFFGGDFIPLTYGGATSGRINVNGGVLYPWAAAANSSDRLPFRLAPLSAVFEGIKYNRDGSLTFDGAGNVTSLAGPVTQTEAHSLSEAVASYVQSNGPLALPGEICDVPEVSADFRATVNPTRNDLVAQTIGNLTTQGNVFSIWVAAQSVKKLPFHTNYGAFEAGDRILAERRMRFLVERYLDLGTDNVPGNINNPGTDGIVGTFDDPVDANYHPQNPKFKYRVLHAEEIR